MSKQRGWREIFTGKTDPVSFLLALIAMLVIGSILDLLLGDRLESSIGWLLTRLIFALLEVPVGYLVYYVLVRLREK